MGRRYVNRRENLTASLSIPQREAVCINRAWRRIRVNDLRAAVMLGNARFRTAGSRQLARERSAGDQTRSRAPKPRSHVPDACYYRLTRRRLSYVHALQQFRQFSPHFRAPVTNSIWPWKLSGYSSRRSKKLEFASTFTNFFAGTEGRRGGSERERRNGCLRTSFNSCNGDDRPPLESRCGDSNGGDIYSRLVFWKISLRE